MSLVSKAETVRSIAAQYGGSVEGTKAIAWAKKQPSAATCGRNTSPKKPAAKKANSPGRSWLTAASAWSPARSSSVASPTPRPTDTPQGPRHPPRAPGRTLD
jgi:hypothetical protein